MQRNRLEAFSDGVLAIVITIMVLELTPPHAPTFTELAHLWPRLLSYLLSFVVVGIYWNNHHHLLHAVHQIDGRVLWPNMHLLFWLSLIPFGTAWMGETSFAPVPVAAYGFLLLMSGVAYAILVRSLLAIQGTDSVLGRAIGRDVKGNVSVVLYVLAIPLALVQPVISCLIYAVVSLIWLIPDRRIERLLAN